MSLGLPDRYSLEWVPDDEVLTFCQNAVCENDKCDFTGEVEGYRTDEYVSWECPKCYREHNDFDN